MNALTAGRARIAATIAVLVTMACAPRAHTPEVAPAAAASGPCAPGTASTPDKPCLGPPTADAPAEAAPLETGEAKSKPGPCDPAVAAAVEIWKAENDPSRGSPPQFEASQEDAVDGVYDFNGDGTADCALDPGWDERWIFVAPRPGEDWLFAGVIVADDLFGFACLSTTTNGLCNISGSQQMIHGESQIRTYAFDGTRYRQTAVRLTAPHPKFGP